MRMRRKKFLDERIQASSKVMCATEGYDYYTRLPSERVNVISLSEVFGNDNPTVLEIGAGKGAYAIQYATMHPNENVIAVEKLSNVIVEGCEKAMQLNLPNLSFLNCSAENLLNFLPTESFCRIQLNFSCPFPKKTYANRRLTHPKFLEIYKKLLTANGEIHLKTDNVDFFGFSTEMLTANGFEIYFSTDDLHSTDQENVITEYERRFSSQGIKILAFKAKLAK